jgi:MFS family permease
VNERTSASILTQGDFNDYTVRELTPNRANLYFFGATTVLATQPMTLIKISVENLHVQEIGPMTEKKGYRFAGIAAWLLCGLFYFYQYAIRSAPSVMIPGLAQEFSLTTMGIGTLLALYYYTYSPSNLIAGALLDRYGAKYTIPAGIIMVAIGSILFGVGNEIYASIGRLMQGAGSAFGFVGAVYVATKNLPARYLALAVGATQMFGMAGGSAGQALVNNLVNIQGLPWQSFWIMAGVVGVILAIFLVVLLQKETEKAESPEKKRSILSIFATYKIVFSNPQSYLSGICAGFLFMPTTIGCMTWGVSYLTKGLNIDPLAAGKLAALVPFGWVIGCPLLGYISDQIGRRKPVLIGGAIIMFIILAMALHVENPHLSQFVIAPILLLLGIASGVAMIPYSTIREVNPNHVKASTAGAMNFIVFMMTAQFSTVIGWLLMYVSKHHQDCIEMTDFRLGLVTPLLAGVFLSIIIAFFIKETGVAATNTR